MGTFAKVAIFFTVALMLLILFMPNFRQFMARAFSNSETIMLPGNAKADSRGSAGKEVELITLLGYDGIPAILNPEFVDADIADIWMQPNEPVLGVSINGDSRAYSIPMLSRHEIVNDVVGGEPIAVTW